MLKARSHAYGTAVCAHSMYLYMPLRIFRCVVSGPARSLGHPVALSLLQASARLMDKLASVSLSATLHRAACSVPVRPLAILADT